MNKKSNKTKKRKEPIRAKLRPSTMKWIQEVEGRFILDSHHSMLLLLAGKAYDRADAAAKDITKNGTQFTDRLGNLRTRPSVKIEVDSSNLFARLLRELALDVEPPEPPRPNAIRRSF